MPKHPKCPSNPLPPHLTDELLVLGIPNIVLAPLLLLLFSCCCWSCHWACSCWPLLSALASNAVDALYFGRPERLSLRKSTWEKAFLLPHGLSNLSCVHASRHWPVQIPKGTLLTVQNLALHTVSLFVDPLKVNFSLCTK